GAALADGSGAVDRGRTRDGATPARDPALRTGRRVPPRAVPLRWDRAAVLRPPARRRRGRGRVLPRQRPLHRGHAAGRPARLRARLPARRPPRVRLVLSSAGGDAGGSRVPDLRGPAPGSRGGGRRIESLRLGLMRHHATAAGPVAAPKSPRFLTLLLRG